MAVEIVYIGYRGIRGTAEIRGETINTAYTHACVKSGTRNGA